MSPVGHTLTGLAIGLGVVPAAWTRRSQAVAFGCFALLANAPDLPLPGWGHERYDISHSVFVTAMGCLLLSLVSYSLLKRFKLSPRRWLLAGCGAWYSHLLLDTFYNHGKGLAMFWPLSNSRVALPIPWFQTLTAESVLCWRNFRVGAIELVCYGTLLALVWWARRRSRRQVECGRVTGNES